jgi:CheY-like chemotaxis protein
VRLPLRRAAPAADSAPGWSATPSAAALAPDPAGLAGIKVLVVDDAADSLELTSEILKGCGATIFVADSAAVALDMLEQERPHVLISDIGMPDIDGFELLRRLRRRNAGRGGTTPAIALTAFTRQQDKVNALHAGFEAYLAKPVEPAELIAAVARLAAEPVDGMS